jgi:hypothetical protein
VPLRQQGHRTYVYLLLNSYYHSSPRQLAHLLIYCYHMVWGLLTLETNWQRAWPDYCMTTFLDNVFTPPLAFCAVTVIMFSPFGSGGVK